MQDRQKDGNVINEDFAVGCFTDVWNGITEIGRQSTEAVKQLFGAVWGGIAEFYRIVSEGLKNFFQAIWRGISFGMWQVSRLICWTARSIFKPILASGANVSGYFSDKFLLGSPAFRKYLQHGLWKSDIPDSWRNWVRQNSGWDIYETMGPIGDNITGVLLGGGIGWLNLFNHFITSLYRNIHNYSHLLGKAGIFGECNIIADQRNAWVKGTFGILSLPIVLPVVSVTNSIDAIGGLFKNLGYSIFRNLRCSMNVLSEYGMFGKRPEYQDDRHLALRLVFGALTLPIVAPLALITNTLDLVLTGIYQFIKQSMLSISCNLRSAFNIVLGDHGMFGERNPYVDDRHLALRLVFGALTLPIVTPLALITNTLDLVLTGIYQFIKQSMLSISRNLRSAFNIVLGDHGMFGPRRDYLDDRHWALRAVFGALTLPIVTPLALVTNTLDIVLTVAWQFSKHVILSLVRNLRSTFNIVLGSHGLFGERRQYVDDRHWAIRVVFGALTLPIVAPLAVITNTLDVILTGIYQCIKHSTLSINRNLRSTYNIVLGNLGLFGMRRIYVDDRHWAPRLVFGTLTLPIVAPLVLVINTLDIVLTGTWQLIKQSMLSLGRNLRSAFNIVLGEYGMFGEHRKYTDDRHWAVRVVFGALTLPVVAPLALVMNTLDIVLTGAWQLIKQSMLSLSRNLRRTFNIVLGNLGLFGERRKYTDDRHLAVRLIFGALTLPVVATLSCLTNSIDMIGAYFKHWRHTILKPAILCTGLIAIATLAIPVFIVRKTLKGLYNCTLRPVVDCLKGREPKGWRVLRGIANVATLGGFSVATKIFKACTGYSHRFGFAHHDDPSSPSEKSSLVSDAFIEVQTRFRQAIDLATKGKFPGTQDKMSYLRPVMRVFFGLRNKAEEILKAFHDEYLVYVKVKQKKGKDDNCLKINSFFQSKRFIQVEESMKNRLRKGEEDVLDAVKNYLNPPSLSPAT